MLIHLPHLGSIPRKIGALTNLRSLNLEENQLTGKDGPGVPSWYAVSSQNNLSVL